MRCHFNLGDMLLPHPVMQEDVSRHTLIDLLWTCRRRMRDARRNVCSGCDPRHRSSIGDGRRPMLCMIFKWGWQEEDKRALHNCIADNMIASDLHDYWSTKSWPFAAFVRVGYRIKICGGPDIGCTDVPAYYDTFRTRAYPVHRAALNSAGKPVEINFNSAKGIECTACFWWKQSLYVGMHMSPTAALSMYSLLIDSLLICVANINYYKFWSCFLSKSRPKRARDVPGISIHT